MTRPEQTYRKHFNYSIDDIVLCENCGDYEATIFTNGKSIKDIFALCDVCKKYLASKHYLPMLQFKHDLKLDL